MMDVAILLIFLLGYLFLTAKLIIRKRDYWGKWQKMVECILFRLYLLWGIIFLLYFTNNAYDQQIHEFEWYGFLSSHDAFAVYTFYTLFILSAVLMWLFYRKLRPWVAFICHIFLIIGRVWAVFAACQIADNKENGFDLWCTVFPVLNILIAGILIVQYLLFGRNGQASRTYKYAFGQKMNGFWIVWCRGSTLVIVFLFPVYQLMVLILMLFGQDYDSMTKVFTDTTTCVLSVKNHPAYLLPEAVTVSDRIKVMPV